MPHRQFLRIPPSERHRFRQWGVLHFWRPFAFLWGLPTPTDIPRVNFGGTTAFSRPAARF